jgi:hypothetical protein
VSATNKRGNPRGLRIAVLGIAILLLLCSATIALPFLLVPTGVQYPNATPDDVCYPGEPSWQYYPAIRRLTVSFMQPRCFATPDSHLQVITWYQQQGWTMKTFYEASAHRNYRFGPFSLMIVNEVMADTIKGSTRILLITGYQVDIGGP